MKKISVVLPCLNESKNLPLLIPQIIKNIPKKYSYEIILVDDGSTDGTGLVIQKIGSKNKHVKGILFYRRFGHQIALRAGIEKATGDAIITMDSDFQHPPEVITKLISKWEAGYDVIQAQKTEDKTASKLIKLQRKFGYFIWDRISQGILIPGVSDFRLMSKEVAKYIADSGESEMFIRGLTQTIAGNPTIMPYKVGSRLHGKSSYSTRMFINMFINGFISFSTKPLRFASILGIVITVISSGILLIDFIRSIIAGKSIIEGWISIVILVLIMNGLIILYLGILGEYIGVLFKETKRRPIHIIHKTVNFPSYAKK